MNWNLIRPWLAAAVRVFLGAVWLWAALSKLSNPRTFVQAVRAYDATPEWLSKAVGYGLPMLEISIAVLLIVGIAVRMAAAVSAVLFVVFLVGVAQASARGLHLECGCFGGGGVTAGPTHYTWDIVRDIGLLILAAFLVVWSATKLSLEDFLARHDYVEPPSPKRMRSEGGQRKYNVLVEAKRKQARERALYINSSLAVIIVLVSLIGVGVQAGRAKISGDVSATNATAANGVVFGKKAAATVDIYEDFQCPHCLAFEQSAGAMLVADARANKAQLRYHTMSFLDSGSNGKRYSSRAANAGICASDVSPDIFVKYHAILFTAAVQPAEGSNGRTDTQLISYAQQAGMTPDQITTFTACVQTEQHKALVAAITDAASKRGINSTPTIVVNGKQVTADLASVEKAIAAADAKGPAPSPSVTPKPSVSPSGSATTTPAGGATGSVTPTATKTS